MSSVLVHVERRVSCAITRIQTRSERCVSFIFSFSRSFSISLSLYLSLSLFLALCISSIDRNRSRSPRATLFARLLRRYCRSWPGPMFPDRGFDREKMWRAERAGGDWLASRCVAETKLKQRVNVALYPS